MSQPVQPGPTPEAITAFVFIVVVAVLYLEHARHAWVDWREHRDGRGLRAVLLAAAIAASLTSLTASSAWRLGILDLDVTVFVSYMVRGILLVSGIVLVVSWYLDRRRDRSDWHDRRE